MRIALALFVALPVTACSQKVKSLLFDIPPNPAVEQSASSQASVGGVAAGETGDDEAQAETARLPIETTLAWNEALELLPKDFMNQPDWSAALRQGVISPRALDPEDRAVEMFQLDFYLKGANPMFDAFFPHSRHVEWMGCDSCHPAVFKYRNNEISMASINQGQYCGACHGKVAFAATACKRCHLAMP